MPGVRPSEKALATAVILLMLLTLEGLGIFSPYSGLGAVLLAITLAFATGSAMRSARLLPLVRVLREMPGKTGEGTIVEVTLKFCNRGGRRLPYLIVADNAPVRVRPIEREVESSLLPGECKRGSYRIKPAPGYHLFPEVLLETGDPLGLFKSWRKIPLKDSISSYPLRAGSYWESLVGPPGRFEAPYSHRKGGGLEFFQLREYIPGDDVRYIAWSATARTGYPMVREGVSEAAMDLALLIDLSLENWPGSPGDSPADWIMRVALDLAGLAASSGGTLTYAILHGETWEEEGPRRGIDTLELLRTRLSLAGPDNSKRRFRLYSLIPRLADRAPPSSILIVLTGAGIRYDSLADALSSTIRPCRWIAIFTPFGGSAVDRAIRTVEEKYYAENVGLLRRLGIRTVLIRDVGGVFAFLEMVKNSVLRGEC